MLHALYGELHDDELRAFEAHLAGCPACSVQMSGLRQTLSIVNTQPAPQPPQGFWERVWPEFVRGIERSERHATGKRRSWSVRRRLVELSVAAALVLLGVLVGRHWPGDDSSHRRVPFPREADQIPPLQDRLDRYLGKSKLVLMSVNHLQDTDAAGLSLSSERKLSRDLLLETNALKRDLQNSREEQLLDLVSQLEIILLQIANLREAHASVGIELARSGIEEQALLFRINLEEMRRASERISKSSRERPAAGRRVG
jgi:hypothetical protein